MSLVLTTPPTQEPITVDDVLDFSRVDADTDTALVDTLITVARQHIEGAHLNRSLLTQTWDWYLDDFPCVTDRNPWGSFIVPRPPLQSVSYIKYTDTDGALQTLSSSLYTVDTSSEPGRITVAYGESWPSVRCIPNAVNVRFIAGWSDVNAIPEPIKQAIRVRTTQLYEHREEILIGASVADLPTVELLLAEYRMYGIA
jgi:uncharacterized phiE125 gp8 family phage protein